MKLATLTWIDDEEWIPSIKIQEVFAQYSFAFWSLNRRGDYTDSPSSFIVEGAD